MTLEESATALREARNLLTVEEKRQLFHVRGRGDYGGWATETSEKYWPDQPDTRMSFVNVCGRAHVASYTMAGRYLADDMAFDELASAVRELPGERADALVGDCRETATKMTEADEPELAQVLQALATFVEDARASA